jgi:hypothetical protein
VCCGLVGGGGKSRRGPGEGDARGVFVMSVN